MTYTQIAIAMVVGVVAVDAVEVVEKVGVRDFAHHEALLIQDG